MKRFDLLRDETRCVCGAALQQPATGRRRRYCSQTCRQRSYRRRRALLVGAMRTQGLDWYVRHRWADYRSPFPQQQK